MSASALADEHARGRRALLAAVRERRGDDRGHRLVEVGVGGDDHAVLAAELGDDPLDVPLAGDDLGGGADDLEADRLRAGERDRLHAGMADERRADVALAGQQRDRRGRDAAREEGLDDRAARTPATARRA